MQALKEIELSSIKDILEPDTYACLLSSSFSSQKSLLRTVVEKLPDKSPESTALYDILVTMYAAERRMSEPFAIEEPQAYISPLYYDIMLSDLKPENLQTAVSAELGVNYLSECGEVPRWPSEGICWGPHSRALASLPVQFKGCSKILNVHFILNTGAPHTYIAPSVVLGLKDKGKTLDHNDSFHAIINGVTLGVTKTPDYNPDGKECHFRGLNVLGTDFMTKAGAKLIVDYDHLTAQVQPRKAEQYCVEPLNIIRNLRPTIYIFLTSDWISAFELRSGDNSRKKGHSNYAKLGMCEKHVFSPSFHPVYVDKPLRGLPMHWLASGGGARGGSFTIERWVHEDGRVHGGGLMGNWATENRVSWYQNVMAQGEPVEVTGERVPLTSAPVVSG